MFSKILAEIATVNEGRGGYLDFLLKKNKRKNRTKISYIEKRNLNDKNK